MPFIGPSNCMVYGETGRGLILNHVKCRVVSFWASQELWKVKRRNPSVLLNFIFRLNEDEIIEFNSHWLRFLENTFNYTGLSNIWLEQCRELSINSVVNMVKSRLNDIFCQDWNAVVWSNRICRNYRIFKSNHKYENYLQTLHQKDAIEEF